MKELRRKDRSITEEEAIRLLSTLEYGVLSMISEESTPYGVPLNYCVIDHCLYFHCATEGQKIDSLKHNKIASFCAVGNTEVLPDQFDTKYESVIVSGEVEEAFDTVKQIALEGLLQKYSPEFLDTGMEYIKAAQNKTRVFKMTIDTITGKARRS